MIKRKVDDKNDQYKKKRQYLPILLRSVKGKWKEKANN